MIMKRIDEYYEGNKDACPFLVLKGIEMVIGDEYEILKDLFDHIDGIGRIYGESPWDENGNFDVAFPIYAKMLIEDVQQRGGNFSFTMLLDQMQSRANAMLAFVLILRQKFEVRGIK